MISTGVPDRIATAAAPKPKLHATTDRRSPSPMHDAHAPSTAAALPASTLHWLAAVPADRPVALLLRHAERDPLAPGDLGYTHPINDSGHGLAHSLGRQLGGRLAGLRSSPLQRCVDTARALADAAASPLPVVADHMLGDPGAYVIDPLAARANWLQLGSAGLMAHLIAHDEALPGTLPPAIGARRLVAHMLACAGATAGVHVFVTHDILLAVTAARHVGAPAGPDCWPAFLEGAFFWQDDDGLHAAYRERHCLHLPAEA